VLATIIKLKSLSKSFKLKLATKGIRKKKKIHF
jgi:hypothetical protein